MKSIFIGYGIEILEEKGKFFLRYDAGEISDRMEIIEITESEVEIAQKSSMDAYKIIIKYQNEMMFGSQNK